MKWAKWFRVVSLMGKKRLQRADVGYWHHRVPDFELVYCGPETPRFAQIAKNMKKRHDKEATLKVHIREPNVEKIHA